MVRDLPWVDVGAGPETSSLVIALSAIAAPRKTICHWMEMMESILSQWFFMCERGDLGIFRHDDQRSSIG